MSITKRRLERDYRRLSNGDTIDPLHVIAECGMCHDIEDCSVVALDSFGDAYLACVSCLVGHEVFCFFCRDEFAGTLTMYDQDTGGHHPSCQICFGPDHDD